MRIVLGIIIGTRRNSKNFGEFEPALHSCSNFRVLHSLPSSICILLYSNDLFQLRRDSISNDYRGLVQYIFNACWYGGIFWNVAWRFDLNLDKLGSAARIFLPQIWRIKRLFGKSSTNEGRLVCLDVFNLKPTSEEPTIIFAGTKRTFIAK